MGLQVFPAQGGQDATVWCLETRMTERTGDGSKSADRWTKLVAVVESLRLELQWACYGLFG